MSELTVGSLSGLAANSYVIDVASGSQLTQPGMILQVVSITKTNPFSTSVSDALQDVTGLSATITPTSATSKVLVSLSISGQSTNNRNGYGVLLRDSTQIGTGGAVGSRPGVTFDLANIGVGNNIGTGHWAWPKSVQFLDSPNTTSATTYKVQVFASNYVSTNVIYINRTEVDNDDVRGVRPISTITLMEIAG